MEQWKEYKLSDILSIVSGFAYKGEYLGKGESLLLGMGCVSYSELFLEKGMRPYAGEFPERYSVEAGDIVLATRQQSDNLPILGMPAIVPQKFYSCTGLQEAYIGDGVTEIAAKAFAECTALKTVVIGKSIQRIGDQAFNTRSSWDQMTLEKITVLFDDIASGSFPVLESGSRGVFPKPGGWDLVSYKIYVPKGTKAEYQKNWSDYSSLIVEMQ